MTETTYSTIKEGETGKLISVSIPYNAPALSTEEQLVLARQIHDDLQAQLQKWLDEQLEQYINGR